MKKFRKNARGAVTVFVTLLLIPSILVTGTGVDIARLYTARSVLQDANQLAANSALAEYDALLQDLYGLYALSQTDEELDALVNKYVKIAVSGDGTEPLDDGTVEFRLFYGGEPSATVTAAPGQNLGNPKILRRQIEEYSLLRGPVVIAQEVIERLREFKKLNADAEVIDRKMAVEDRIDEIDEIYRKIYDAILNMRGAQGAEEQVLSSINDRTSKIYEQFQEMADVREDFTAVVDDDNSENDYLISQYEDHYEDVAGNIPVLVDGGTLGEMWAPEEGDDPTDGSFLTSEQISGSLADMYEKGGEVVEDYKERLRNLGDLCKTADEKKVKLQEEIAALETELDKNECSSELKQGLEEPSQDTGESVIDGYKKMVKYNLTALANDVLAADQMQLQLFASLMNGFKDRGVYASKDYAVDYSDGFLRNFTGETFDIRVEYRNKNKINTAQEEDRLAQTVDEGNGPQQYSVAQRYINFEDSGPEQKEFYDMLVEFYGTNTENKNKEASIKKVITALFASIKEMFGGLVVNPEGAHKYEAGTDDSSGEPGSDFAGKDTDWGNNSKIKKSLKSALKSDFLTNLGNAANSIGNKMLLLTYASEMFSCYSTGRGTDEPAVTMSGATLGLDVNYYYQSELEYIYNGDLTDAIANVNSLGSMLLLIRFVLDYVVSFSVDDVNSMVRTIRDALGFLGPISIGVAELARLGFALGEAFVDLSLLRGGHRVALIKSSSNWRFSISGFADMAKESVKKAVEDAVEDAVDIEMNTDKDELSDKNGMYYVDYVRLFLLFVDGDDMAERISNLIELNLTNKENNLGSIADREEREAAMTAAQKYDMGKALTGFSITTEAELGMMFISMPIAQNQFEGITPPKTITVSATDYRGY